MSEAPNEMKPRIAVVPIEGELVPGESGSGFAGADTIVEQIERALELERLSAVVLRVNSPGGSVFASEVIRQKVLQVKERGIPVLVSMGAVAASGGYYIAADADQIWALPGTITGSIGVFAAFPTVEKLYDWVGASVDGVASTPLAAAIRFDTGIEPMGERIINSYIGRVYQDFVGLVAEGRGKTWDEIDAVAGGRVWSGADAKEIGLVDQLGTLANTIDAAAELAEIDEWEVRLIGTPISPEQLFLEQLGRNLGTASFSKHSVVARFASQLAVPLRTLDSLQDPRNLYVRCLECNPGL
jgi:protease-4